MVQERIEALVRIATEHGFTLTCCWATSSRAWGLTEHGHVEEGIAQMRQSLTAIRTTGMEILLPYWLLLLAEAHGKSGQAKEG